MNDIARAFTRNDVRIALVGGLVVGGVTGYFVARKTLATKFEAIASAEIEDVKEHYHKQAMLRKEGVYSDPANLVENPAEEPAQESDELTTVVNNYHNIVAEQDYSSGSELVRKAVEGNDEDVVEETTTVRNVFRDPQPTIGQRDPDIPYVISVEEFMNNEEYGFDQITVTYYRGDETLVDERDEMIPDVLRVVGENTLESVDEQQSNDPNIVYVRNERLRTDFEVILDDGKYSVSVLGMHDDERND